MTIGFQDFFSKILSYSNGFDYIVYCSNSRLLSTKLSNFAAKNSVPVFFISKFFMKYAISAGYVCLCYSKLLKNNNNFLLQFTFFLFLMRNLKMLK